VCFWRKGKPARKYKKTREMMEIQLRLNSYNQHAITELQL